MVSYSSAVSISRPAAQIYPYLLETTKQAVWSNVPVTKVSPPGDLGYGSTLEVSFGVGPLKAVVGLEISTMDFGRRLAFRSISGPINWKGEYNLSDSGNGTTKLSQKGQVTFRGAWRLIQPIAGGQIRRGEINELRRIKKLIEATPALPA